MPKSVPILSDIDLASYPIERMRTGGVRHAAAITTLLGTYDVKRAECTYFDHRHKEGFLLRTRCNRFIAVGRFCGRKYVDGFEQLHKDVGIVKSIQLEQSYQLTKPGEIVAALTVIEAEIRNRLDCLNTLRSVIPVLHAELRRAFERDDRYVEIEVMEYDARAERRVLKMVPKEVNGLQFFGGGWPASRVTELQREAAKFAVRWGRSVVMNESNFKEFSDRRQAFDRTLAEIRDLISGRDVFWISENLDFALRKVFKDNQPNGLQVVGNTLRLPGTPALIVGPHGVRTELD